jgi:arylsulfatase A-like enzyme
MSDSPNILLIMADDSGYSDLGCYGGDIETPHLDRLAANGLRFTHFYNTARCCPARASLLTGLYPHQAGMGWMTAANLGTDGYTGDLNDRCLTIAECLRPAGYATYMSGKWHLTYEKYCGPEGPRHSWPRQRGFDRFFGTIVGGGSYFTPTSLTVDNQQIEPPEGFYYTDAISDRACTFVDEHCRNRKDQPFFLYVAYTAPHWPLHAKPGDIAHYRGRFRRGWDELRGIKFERMKALGILDEGWGLSERDEGVPAWNDLSEGEQDVFDLRMAIYAAQVTSLDAGVGRIVEALAAHDALEDTLILFLSDNGGCHEEIHRGSPDPATFGTDASFESYGRPWANVSNVPFREFKSWVHEGGIATPLIAHWPNGLSSAGLSRPGALVHQIGHIVDVMPTCLELSGASHPVESAQHVHGLQGRSLVPVFQGRTIERDCVFWEHEGNRALREGKWKLVAKGVGGRWELYDMEADRSELNDLAGDYPKRVKRMAEKWYQIALSTDVIPLDGRSWNERIRHPTGK